MPASTLESRWFFSEPIPGLDAWEGKFETRTDWYAPIAERTCSTKLRQGGIELKFLHGEYEIDLGSALSLSLQRWEKIRQSLSGSDLKALDRFASNHWLGIQKRRRTWWYREVQGDIEPCQADATGAIQVEWAHLTCGSHSAWTFCIEGPATCAHDSVVRAARAVANEFRFDYRQFPPPASYPDFILQSQLQSRC